MAVSAGGDEARGPDGAAAESESATPDATPGLGPEAVPAREPRIEVLLEHLSYWPMVGGAVRLARRRREQVLYLVVGGWNTLFGYLVWALLQYLVGGYIFYWFILIMAWFPAVLNAYFGYRIVVFRSKGSILRELPRFSLVYVGTLCITLVALPILLRVLPFSIYVTQALFTAVMVVASYVSHKYFSFHARHGRPGGPGPAAN